MPIVIDEVVAEVEPTESRRPQAEQGGETRPQRGERPFPLQILIQYLNRLEERQARLKAD